MQFENRHPLPFSEFCGVLHIHTTYSDGGVKVGELADAAHEVGLDFVVVNDHMTLKGKEDGFEGFHKGVMLVIGYEHHDLDKKNHYLVLGTSAVCGNQVKPQKYIDDVRKEGGIGFLAHPMERRHYFKQYPPFPWTDWSVEGFDGIEIWNQMSEWVENLKRWRSFFRVLYPRRFLISIPPSVSAKWDHLNRERFVAGIGGVDAHTMRVKAGWFTLTIFPIKVELKGIRTHLYLPHPPNKNDWPSAERLFLNTLRDGHGFISNLRRGDARGTKIYLTRDDGSVILPGKVENPTLPPATLHVLLPAPGEVRLIHNGELFDINSGAVSEFAIDRCGVYRVEVFRKARAWIYSNPFPVGTYPL